MANAQELAAAEVRAAHRLQCSDAIREAFPEAREDRNLSDWVDANMAHRSCAQVVALYGETHRTPTPAHPGDTLTAFLRDVADRLHAGEDHDLATRADALARALGYCPLCEGSLRVGCDECDDPGCTPCPRCTGHK